MALRAPRRSWLVLLPSLLALAVVAGGWSRPIEAEPGAEEARPSGVFRKGDRVAWVGSSSTRIGVWPDTVEFLLRTRHPELNLSFGRFTTGGGTFRTGLDHLDEWLGGFRPTVVVFNYGGNDANAGRDGLPRFLEEMDDAVEKVQARGARVALVTPQAADIRKSGCGAAAKRALYAETMLEHGRERGWTVIDTHHPLENLQRTGRKADPKFTILRDTIHLTRPAYVAWGATFYDRLDLPFVRCEAALSWGGNVTAEQNCSVTDVSAGDDVLAFTRTDKVLPILPPGPLPLRFSTPLEAHSRYLLRVTGQEPGRYEIRCEGRLIGQVDSHALSAGVNLNSLLLDGDQPAPWADLAEALWNGRELDKIGRTRWRFEVRKL